MSVRARVPTWSIQLVVGLGLLALILNRLDLAELRDSVTSISPWLLAAGALVGFGSRYLAAVRMRLIMQRLAFSASSLEIFSISLKSSYLSFFLPGNLAGGATRWYLLKSSGSGGANAFVGIVFDRLNDVSSLVVIGLAASLMTRDVPGAVMVQIAFAGLFGSILLVQAMVLNARFLTSARRLAERTRLDRWPLFARVFDALAESSFAFHDLPAAWQGRLWITSLISHAVGIASYHLLARSVGIELSMIDLAWVQSAVVIIGLLPVSFAGLGVREGALITLLAPYGISAPEAVSFSLTLFLRLVATSAAGGGLLALDLLRERRTVTSADPGTPP